MALDRRRYSYVRTPDPIYVETENDALDWADYFTELPRFGYDTETTGLDPIRTRVKFFGFADKDSRICCPVRLLPCFEPALVNRKSAKRLTNAKVDMHWTANHGIIIRGPLHDSLGADWLYDENRRGAHGLKETSRDHLRLRMRSFKTVFGDVGKTDHEVETLCRIHDILEARSDEDATDVLVFLGQAEGDEDVLKALRKLYLSRKGGYKALDARKLLKIGRDFEIATRTTGAKGFVVDFLRLVDEQDFFLTPKERAEWEHLLTLRRLVVEAHEVLADELRKMVRVERDPLDLLRLTVGDYASLDPWASNALFDDFYEEVLQQEVMYDVEEGEEPYTLWDYFHETMVPFTRVLWNMERRGFTINLDAAAELDRPLRKEIGRLDREITKLAGFELNPNSADQIRDALFFFDEATETWKDPFGDVPMIWTKGGQTGIKKPSTEKKVLESYSDKGHPLAEAILEYRKLKKLHGTYVEKMPVWVDHRGRVHTTLKQTGTVTGRLSSSDPNLQNIPARGELGHKIRHLFVAGKWGDCPPDVCMDELVGVKVPKLPDDYPMTLIVADYAQLEMRIMAHFSEDEAMIAAIEAGDDLHCRTGERAQEVLRKAGLAKFDYDYAMLKAAKKRVEEGSTDPLDLALVAIRDAMKAVGFGLLYGIGAVKLGRQLGLPVTESFSHKTGRLYYKCAQAEAMIDGYFSAYPGAKQFIEDTHYWCEQDLMVQTLVGRPRRLPDIISEDKGIAAQARRQSVNSIIQGTAADITNEAMLSCELDKELRRLGVRMLLQIHDELVFEVPDHPDFYEPAMARIKELMEDPFEMRVPIQISMNRALSWGECK